MKSSELISILQSLDPSGETDVTVGNLPIYLLEKMPAYYNGPKYELIQDKNEKVYYNVIGYKITDKGHKIIITTIDLEDYLFDSPDDEVQLDLCDNMKNYYLKLIERKRQTIKTEDECNKS